MNFNTEQMMQIRMFCVEQVAKMSLTGQSATLEAERMEKFIIKPLEPK